MSQPTPTPANNNTSASDESKARILEQVRKIMTHAAQENGAGQEEIENALNIARRLMAKHNISEDELLVATTHHQATTRAPEVIEVEAFSRAGSLDRHDIRMAHIDVLFDCQHFTEKYQKDMPKEEWEAARDKWVGNGCKGRYPSRWEDRQKVVFYGLPQDVNVVVLLYQELLTIKRAMARARYGSKPGWSAKHTAYAVGFSEGLAQRARQLKQQEKADASSPEKAQANGLSIYTTAIVLAKDILLTQHATKLGLVTSKSKSVLYDSEAYSKGHADSQNVALTPYKLDK